jgi:hypothetical protein
MTHTCMHAQAPTRARACRAACVRTGDCLPGGPACQRALAALARGGARHCAAAVDARGAHLVREAACRWGGGGGGGGGGRPPGGGGGGMGAGAPPPPPPAHPPRALVTACQQFVDARACCLAARARYPPLRVFVLHESGRSPPGSARPDKAGACGRPVTRHAWPAEACCCVAVRTCTQPTLRTCTAHARCVCAHTHVRATTRAAGCCARARRLLAGAHNVRAAAPAARPAAARALGRGRAGRGAQDPQP